MKRISERTETEPLECPVCGEGYHHIAKVGTDLDPEWGDEAKIICGMSLVFERESRGRARRPSAGDCVGRDWRHFSTALTSMVDNACKECTVVACIQNK